MKQYIFFLLLSSFSVVGQDNSFSLCDSLAERWKPQYYFLKTKYPVSSETLVKEINTNLLYKPTSINGFITLRFIVNCKGQIGKLNTFQIDGNYKEISFDTEYVDQLINFVKGLKEWKMGVYKEKPIDYYTYFTFKVENGNIKEIVP